MDIVFGTKWFQKHQAKLLWLLNAPIIKYWFRWVMRIRKSDCPINETISEILPNNFSFAEKRVLILGEGFRNQRTTDFRTHDKFSKRLYYAFKPFWYLLHVIDWVAFDRYEELAQLSFGFSTLTQYPQAGSGGGNVSCDGSIFRDTTSETLANIRSGAGTSVDPTTTYLQFGRIISSSTTNQFNELVRSLVAFDTSALTSSATISSAVMSFDGSSVGYKNNDFAGTAPDFHIAGATPANANALVTGDYNQCQTTSFGSLSFATVSTSAYSDWTLNASGISAISKTSISKFSLQNSWDLNNNFTGTWGSNKQLDYYVTSADNTGTAKDPKLVITYTTTSAPTVTTQATTDIEKTTATGNGNVTSDGGDTITERGVCIGASVNPTTSDTKFTASGTTGAFTASITGLTKGTHYHLRAYAINSIGTSYGSDVEWTAKTDGVQTAGLIYDVKITPTAPTKSLAYAIKATPSAITKGLIYDVKITPSALTKGLIYDVKITPSGITKSLQYAVKPSISLTKDLKYTIKITQTPITFDLTYGIKTTFPISKDLKYIILSPVSISKDLGYFVTTTPSAISIDLAYYVDVPTVIENDLTYTVKAPASTEQDLGYSIILTKSTTKGLIYDIRKTISAITKSLRYAIKPSISQTKSLRYQVTVTPSAITKSLAYSIDASIPVMKYLKYTLKTTPAPLTLGLSYHFFLQSANIQKGLTYAIDASPAITKSLTYTLKTHPGISLECRYSVYVYPYKNETSPYQSSQSPYVRLG